MQNSSVESNEEPEDSQPMTAVGANEKNPPNAEDQEEGRPRSAFRELADVAFYALSILLFINVFVWQNFQIPTSSMENSLLIGDHLTVNTFMFQARGWEKKIFPFRDIRRGDVVVFKYPKDIRMDYIKRCIGLPGDRFYIKEDRVYINDQPLEEEYAFYKKHGQIPRDPDNAYRPKDYDRLKPGLENADRLDKVTMDLRTIRYRTLSSLSIFKSVNPELYQKVKDRIDAAEPGRIPDGFYLMMGDNRNNSSDSRFWGLVPIELVQGRAWFIWWSYGEELNTQEAKGMDWIMTYLRVPIYIWTRTHIKESFTFIR